MPTSRMDLVCTVCGEALELCDYDPQRIHGRGAWLESPDADEGGCVRDFLNEHRHDADPERGPTHFQLAFEEAAHGRP